jgi:hypothetical protein
VRMPQKLWMHWSHTPKSSHDLTFWSFAVDSFVIILSWLSMALTLSTTRMICSKQEVRSLSLQDGNLNESFWNNLSVPNQLIQSFKTSILQRTKVQRHWSFPLERLIVMHYLCQSRSLFIE